MSWRRKSRELALQILYQNDTAPRPLEELLDSFWQSRKHPPPEVQRFAESLALGALKHLDAIDALTRKYSDHWVLERMAVVDRNIIRIAIYEFLYQPDIPAKVTINESVEMAKKFSTEGSGAFVNGILDSVYRERIMSPQGDGSRG